MEIPNFVISILGWLIWNIAEAEITRRQLNDDGNPATSFSPKEYAVSHIFIWCGSFLCIFVLLWMGYRQLDINPVGSLIGVETKAWHDLYILAAGAAFDAFIFGVKKVKSFFAKKEKEL